MFRYDAVQLFDLGFGPRLVSVTPPLCDLSPSSKIRLKDCGKAPGLPTESGWIGVDVNAHRFRCHDYVTAKLWRDTWGANVGFVVGDGFTVIDNDQGRIFSEILQQLLSTPLRRYVFSPGHERDAFLFRVIDFIGEGAPIANRTLQFRNGVSAGQMQILASGKQFVVAGHHPGTRGPYVWDRELESLDAIPVLTIEAFDRLLAAFVAAARELGWNLDGAGFSLPPRPLAVSFRKETADRLTQDTTADTTLIAHARALLEEIPNRDVPPGETPNAIDQWLDVYDNWTRVAYALAAFLGLETAHTPEAFELWREWSDGRAQGSQTSESVWRSVLHQPLRYGGAGLLRLVRSLVRPSIDDFPDIAPDDPMINTDNVTWGEVEAQWIYCRSQGFIDTQTGDIIARQAFSDDNAHLARALTRELRPGHRGKIPSVADLFLSQPLKRRVRGVVYTPGGVNMISSKGSSLPIYNLWRPTTHGTALASATDVKPWLDHVEFVMGSTLERDRFLKWSAFVSQHPKFKPNWHFLIMSLQGVGKDTLVQPVKLAVGDGNWRETLIFKLSEPFNDVVQTKLLIVGETRQSEHGFINAHDVGTRLKELLARPPEMLIINKKYQHPYEIPNRVAVILFSNEENPLYLERGQRRVHVVNRRDAKVEPPGYYQTLWAWLEQGGDELAASYLLHYPLTDADLKEFIGGVAPASDDKTELEHLNLHPALAALEELLADAGEGKGPFRDRVATQKEIADHLTGEVRHKPSSQLVRTWLLDMERRKTGVRRLRVDSKTPHLAGLIGDGKYSGRLWLLGETAPDGRAWTDMTNTEIVALWKKLPPPRNATVHRHPAAGIPDDEELV